MTQQIADSVTYNGGTYYIYDKPILQYRFTFKPKERPQFNGLTTANWCGYEADYTIKDNKLFLIKFAGNLSNTKTHTYKVVGMDHFFPGQEEVFATWFTGSLTLYTADQLYEDNGFSNSVSTDKLYLEFKGGELMGASMINSKVLDILNSRESQLWDIKNRRKVTFWWWMARKYFHRWIFFDDEFYS